MCLVDGGSDRLPPTTWQYCAFCLSTLGRPACPDSNLWNELPHDVTSCVPSLSVFRRRLETFLSRHYTRTDSFDNFVIWHSWATLNICMMLMMMNWTIYIYYRCLYSTPNYFCSYLELVTSLVLVVKLHCFIKAKASLLCEMRGIRRISVIRCSCSVRLWINLYAIWSLTTVSEGDDDANAWMSGRDV